MKQKTVTAKVFVLILICLSALLVIYTHQSRASNALVVPDTYPSISAAIGNASQGDTILVKSGVYFENPRIDKSLSVVGEDSKSTIVVGSGGVERGGQAVFTLAADSVTLSGFTIESLNYSSSTYYAMGVRVEGDNCTLNGNNIQNTYVGVFSSVQSSIVVSQNNVTANLKDGIRFFGGASNRISENNIVENGVSGIVIEGYSTTISKNTIKNNGRGIGLGSSYSVVFGNSITGNSESGIFLASSNSIISANDIAENKWGVYLTPRLAAPNDNKIYHNNFVNNGNNVYVSSPFNVNFWDNGYPSGGNHWSDYASTYPNAKEIDTSGLGESPYVINANNTDKYPLIAPFNGSNAGELPSINPPAAAKPNSLVASWSFDEVRPDGVTPDATGNNPAILGGVVGNVSFAPTQVDGKFGKALSFNGQTYVSVPASPSIEISSEITIDAWINVQSFKNVTYNNIVVKCFRTTAPLPTRTVGLAVNGELLDTESSAPQGALRGYVYTETEGFNEIVTTEPVISLNQWTHVVFTRSLATGMHIYVDGAEKTVTVTSGVLNPKGSIEREAEIYIGHDATCTIDEVRVSNTAIDPLAQPLWMQWWFWTAATATAGAGISLFVYFKRRNR